jgi:hypothetical protein
MWHRSSVSMKHSYNCSLSRLYDLSVGMLLVHQMTRDLEKNIGHTNKLGNVRVAL